MSVNVVIVFYSVYGHTWRMAEAVAEGVRSVAGASVQITQVPELLAPDVLAKMGATEAKKAFAHVPLVQTQQLAAADAVILGCGTRFGLIPASMQAFIDTTGGLWSTGALIGKVGSAFSGSASQHGGQETTLVRLHTFFLHQGMLVAGCPYSAKGLVAMGEMSGGTPYGATTIVGPTGERMPSANELDIARFQGKFVTENAAKLAAK